MDGDFVRERIIQLRMQKGVSARDMGLSLGQSESYINKIENKKSLPSMEVFFYICDYFRISPKEFFDEGTENPVFFNELLNDLKALNKDQLSHISAIVKGLKK